MSRFFKSKKPTTETSLLEVPQYSDVAKDLSTWLRSQIGRPEAEYPGKLTAGMPKYPSTLVAPFPEYPMKLTAGMPKYPTKLVADFPQYPQDLVSPLSERQRRGLGYLDKYITQEGLPELTTLAESELKKTLTGEYSPETSLYYKAFREGARRNLAETLKDIANVSAGGGRFWTGARLGQQAKSSEAINLALNQLLGEMTERERERRLGVVPQAVSLGREIAEYPAQKAQTILGLGDIERQLEQERIDRNITVADQKRDYEQQKINAEINLAEIARQVEQEGIDAEIRLAETKRAYEQQKIDADIKLAELARQVEQEGLTAQYQDWLRRYSTYPLNIAELASRFQSTVPPVWNIVQTPGRASPFERILPSVAQIAASILTKSPVTLAK